MSQERALQLLQQGINAQKAGQIDQARQIFQQAVKLDPRNETIWLWLASVARDDKERVFCLKQILTINPTNEKALQGLKRLGVGGDKAPEPAASVPRIPPDRLPNIQNKLDDFLKMYNSRPQTVLDFEWVRKTKRRYGEAAAVARQRRAALTRYSAIGVVGIILLGILAFGASLLLQEDTTTETQRSFRPTLTPTAFPTATPGIPNTLVPEGTTDGIAPVALPTGLTPGNEYFPIPSPTYSEFRAISLRSSQGSFSSYDLLLFFNQGDYDRVIRISDAARNEGVNVNKCEPETYYYAILSYIEKGGSGNLKEAGLTLQEARTRAETLDPNDNNGCDNSELIETAACALAYARGLDDPEQRDIYFDEALSLCNSAIRASTNQNPPKAPVPYAGELLARIYISRGDYDSAADTLEDFVEAQDYPTWGGDVTLLLLRADVALLRGNTSENALEALKYIERALYVDPTSAEALSKKVVALLRLADNDPNDRLLQILRYGTAATAAEAYLIRYPRNFDGYILLAEARLKEGNPDRAIETLNRVLSDEVLADANEEQLATIKDAYAVRVQIYEDQRDWQRMYNDLISLTQLERDNPWWEYSRLRLAIENPELELATNNDIVNAIDDLLADSATVTELRNAFPASTEDPIVYLRLAQAELLTRTCQYDPNISCNPEAVLATLSDDFITNLNEAEEAVADARSYRAEALFLQAEAEEDPEATSLPPALLDRYVAILPTELNQALEIRTTPEDLYLLGRIYEKLNEPERALQAYEWISFWTQQFDYPFSSQLTQSIQTLREALNPEAEAS